MKFKILYSIIILCLLIVGCNNKFPRTLEDGMSTGNMPFDTISIQDFLINDIRIRTTKDILIKEFGAPKFNPKKGGCFTPRDHISKDKISVGLPLENMIEYKTYLYEGCNFAVWENTVQLREVDFAKFNGNLSFQNVLLNNKTKPKDLIEVFPNSYKWQKYGLSTFIHLQSGSQNQVSLDRITWMQFRSSEFPGVYKFEFAFVDNRLRMIFFPVYE